MLPYYSLELRRMRGETTTQELADELDVSSETIRQIETGRQAPKNHVLLKWLMRSGEYPSNRPDILLSVLDKRVELNSRVREYVVLNGYVTGRPNFDREKLKSALVGLLKESGPCDEDRKVYLDFQVDSILDKLLR